MECFRPLFDHLAWIEHQFWSSIRDSWKAGSLWVIMRGVRGVRKSIHYSWLAKGLGLGLLCKGFKGIQEEASTLQIGSVAFPPGQSLSQTIWPRWGIKFLSLPVVQTLHPVTFAYSLSSQAAVVMRQLRRWKGALMKVIDMCTQEDLHGALQKLLELWIKCIAAGGDYFEGGLSFMCVLLIKVPQTKMCRKLI